MGDDLINGWWTADEALRHHPDLVGAALVWREYHRPSESWDHDHCAFCWATVTDYPNAAADDLKAAFTDDVPQPPSPQPADPKFVPAPAGSRRWVCPTCAEAYRHVFNWTTSGGPAIH